MQTGTITVDTPDGAMPVYEVLPDTVRGGVVVVQEAFGVNEHIEDVTRRVASLGYHAVAPHFFHRTGSAVIPYGEFQQVMEHFAALNDDKVLSDVDAAVAHLVGKGLPANRVGIVGFCFGGRVTFLTAARRQLGAAVGFYGGGIVTSRIPALPALVDEAKTLQTPWLGLFGDDDQSIPVEDVERLREELRSAPVEAEVVRYAGAGHGFFRDVSDDFRPEASEDAWRRLQNWFDRHLGA